MVFNKFVEFAGLAPSDGAENTYVVLAGGLIDLNNGGSRTGGRAIRHYPSRSGG